MKLENEPLVSIVSPVYNSAKYIRETINSVLAQTYKNWELLFINDCSTDNSVEIINSYDDNRIRIIENEKNSGAAISRNKAIMQAKGKYIAFLDSDDIWSKYKLERQIMFMEENNYYFTYTNYEEIDESGRQLNKMITGPKKIGIVGMFNYCWPGCLTVVYNQEKIGKIQIANLKKNNDYAMWLKIIKKSKCYLLNENLASYRIRVGSISHVKLSILIKHHYYLFKNGENKNSIVSFILTLNNMFYGIIKKLFFNKKV